LISCRGEGAIQKSEPEGLPGVESVIAAETMVGESMIDETMAGAAFAEADQGGGPETILLVEDEAFVRKVTAEVLESAGYKLLIAGTAAEAFMAYRRGSEAIDLLLADVAMPGMSGPELATEFESLCPRARVLLMSGHAEQFAWCELSRYGRKYLAKPFCIRTLLRRVREVLDTNPFDLGKPA
jgi:two-component system, cell cycle sensor histidine kinase and response regulator CckA